MKQFDLNNAVPNQNSLSINNAGCGMNQLTNRAPSRHVIFQSLLRLPVGWRGGFNIFLIQNKGKGPPGVSRSPAVGNGLFPDHPPDDWIETSNEQTLNIRQTTENFNTEYQTNYKNINANILQTLNFTNMKKQILFLAFFILAALASVTSSYGQATHGSNYPLPLAGCIDDPLHPIPGKPYTYGVDGTGSTYTWWATKDFDFIKTTSPTTTTNMIAPYLLTKTAGQLLEHDGNYATAGVGNTVSITWSAQLLAGTASGTIAGGKSPTFVVVQAEDAVNCTNNFKVYQLDPVNAFTVDILPLKQDGTADALGYTASITTCFSKVESATYAVNEVTYDYGTNVLYYEVVAANFTNFFNTEYKLDGLQVGQTASIDWSYNSGTAGAWTLIESGIVGTGSIIDVAGTTASATVDVDTNTSDGVSIYIRVTIDNGKYEGLVDSPIVLSVEGSDSEGEADKDNTTCLVGSPTFEDKATQTLSKRPTVTPDSSSNPDVFVAPAP